MKPNKIESALGIAPGPTLIALANLAIELERKQAAHAFKALAFFLPWLISKGERAHQELVTDDVLEHAPDFHRRAARSEYLATPLGVLPFAHTGTYSDHFGFVLASGKPCEELPIVYVRPAEPDEATRIVAANLRELLGLLAIGSGLTFATASTKDEWLVYRKEYFGDQPKRLAEMEALSNALCTIPNVHRPVDPARVVGKHGATRFALTVPMTDPARKKLALNAVDRARSALVRAQRLLGLGELAGLGRALALAEQGRTYGATWARGSYLRARVLLRMGRVDEAQAALEELTEAWLDEEPRAPPSAHARRVVHKDELLALWREAQHPATDAWSARIRHAGPVREPEGEIR